MNLHTRRITLAGPVGQLEATIDDPAAAAVLRGIAVLCHPHPLHGGTLDNKVVQTLARVFVQLGYRAVRFNFRGVGGSHGAWDEGRGEVDDALAVVGAQRDAALPLVLGGFSFGSVVALRVAARDRRVRAVAALGFPLVRFGDAATLRAPSQPRLFVQGERDQFGPGESLRALVEPLPPPRELVVIPGASHFFDGQLDAMQSTVSAWAARRPWEEPGG